MTFQKAVCHSSFRGASHAIVSAFLSLNISTAIAQVVHVSPIDHDITDKDYAPCLLMEKKAQDIASEESVRLGNKYDKINKSTMSREERNEWFYCKMIDVQNKAIKTVLAYESACITSCSSGRRYECVNRVENAKGKYLSNIEQFKRFCPDEYTHNTNSRNTSVPTNTYRAEGPTTKKIDYKVIKDRVIVKRLPESDDVTGVLRKGSIVNIYEEWGAWVQISPSNNSQYSKWIERNAIIEQGN